MFRTINQFFQEIIKNKPALFVFLTILLSCQHLLAGQIAITIDDPRTSEIGNMNAVERTNNILKVLNKHNLHTALFVCSQRVDSNEGKKLLMRWDDAGHIIGNHSYSHLNYNSPKVSFDNYSKDIIKGEAVISNYKNFKKIYRVPFLKEGDTKEKRDLLRNFLQSHGYKVGHVTIDASDWYIDMRMREKLKSNPNANLEPYKEYYLQHIWDRTQFYNSLAKKMLERDIKHTLLIHDNLLTALFLDDLIQMFKNKGWKIIDATEAFTDPVFDQKPDIIPAGESIIWSLAKKSGKYDKILRYPAEDGEYEKKRMDELGL